MYNCCGHDIIQLSNSFGGVNYERKNKKKVYNVDNYFNHGNCNFYAW